MSETLSAERYPIEIIQGVEGLCIGLNNYRLVGPKPWGGGTVVKRWHVSLAELGKAIPEVATIAALTTRAEEAEARVAELEAAGKLLATQGREMATGLCSDTREVGATGVCVACQVRMVRYLEVWRAALEGKR